MKRLLILMILGTLTVSAFAELPHTGNPLNYDVRMETVEKARFAPSKAQLAAIEALRAEMPGLNVEVAPETGVVRKLSNHTGYLTVPLKAGNAKQNALAYVRANRDLLGLTAQDLESFRVSDEVFSAVTGATHLYFQQTHRNIPVYNAQLHVNVNRDGRILSVNNAFMPDVARFTAGVRPSVGAVAAVQGVAEHLGIELSSRPEVIERRGGPTGVTVLRASEVSVADITAQLVWMPFNRDDIRLAWNLQVDTPVTQKMFDMNVDAQNARVLTRFSWTADATYRVFQDPDESPLHGTTSHVLVVNPEDPVSQNGWLANPNGTTTGNNVTACADRDGNNSCDSGAPTCSSGVCDFAANLANAPSTYIPAAITNLFYWNNLIHDVQYKYGFDEAGGNFQESNFGLGGSGSDSVNADAQDNANGSSRCNANFSTPTDGGNPRMQMFLCNNTSPERDGDFDNGVIVHEYGHGISIRQVGGPGTSSCLNNSQQAGEGWSDLFGLIYTAENGDAGTDSRGIGTYLFGQAPNGPGIRDLPYSTDPAVNNWTYESISGASIPHGVGSRWAQVGWELYWALVAKHGFSTDLLNPAPAWTGSHRAMLYINEGLKNTACSPTFVDNRDGIVQAAIDNFGGEDVCDVWQVFADYGLGANAISGGSGSTNPTNGFDLPPECGGPAGPPTGNCAAGETEYVGRLSTGSAIHGEGAKTNPSGTLQCTVGSANLDLYLDQESCNFFSCSWSTAASSTSTGCNESINFSGSSTYRWRVVHASGGQADYALCTND